MSKRYFNFLLAALLDRLVERNRMPWQPDIAEFLNETVVEILCRDRPEGLSGLSGLEREIQDELLIRAASCSAALSSRARVRRAWHASD